MVLMRLAPAFSTRVRQTLNLAGNAILVVALLATLIKLGPALKQVSPWAALAVVLLAVGCLLAVRLLLGGGPISTVQTLSIGNTNRHVGLALLLSMQHLHAQRTVPVIAAYALAALLVMAVYTKLARRNKAAAS